MKERKPKASANLGVRQPVRARVELRCVHCNFRHIRKALRVTRAQRLAWLNRLFDL
jgi:hypothetical protein